MANSLVDVRKKAKIKQKDIAAAMGVSPVTVLRWEKGYISPKPAELKMYLELCGANTDEFFLPTL